MHPLTSFPPIGPAVLMNPSYNYSQQAQGLGGAVVPAKRSFSQAELDQGDENASAAAPRGATQSEPHYTGTSLQGETVGVEADASAVSADQKKDNAAAGTETPQREVTHAEQEQGVEMPAAEQEKSQSVAKRVRNESYSG